MHTILAYYSFKDDLNYVYALYLQDYSLKFDTQTQK